MVPQSALEPNILLGLSQRRGSPLGQEEGGLERIGRVGFSV